MATKGRGGDSMLVHMTPGEVRALQALAERHGGTLTINPETGQPEANFLKRILPMVAGFALGPAGFGLMSAGMAGAAVGGITALSTGSLSRGLMAGLGAYGGASLGASLAGAGEAALTSAGAPVAENVAGIAVPPIEQINPSNFGFSNADKLSAGLKTVTDSPAALGKFAKSNLGALGAATTPILAGDMVPTTTQMPDLGPSYIRPYIVDQYTQRAQALDPIDASTVRLPKRNFAGGGIVALAEGGAAPGFSQFTASQINDYIADNKLDAAGIAAATKQFNVDPNAVIGAQNAQEAVSNVYRNVLGRDPDPVGLAYWSNQVTSGERTGQEMYNEFLKSAQSLLGTAGAKEIFRPGISLEDAVKPFAGYSSADKRNIADEWVRNTLGREVTDADRQQQWYKDATNAASMNTYDAAQNIFGQFQNYAARTGQSTADALANARAILASKNLTEADVLAQTGKSLNELVRGTNLDLGLFQASQLNAPGSIFDFNSLTAKARPVTTVPTAEYYGNPTGPAPTPGDITTNADGSRTVHPNIPGRPTGGFAGMQQVKDAYTAGGGSLGYTPYAPKTLQEFQNRFTNTGGSKQAYDYLMNKGAADIRQPITKTGELMLPYAEAMGLRRPGRIAMPRKPDQKKEEVVTTVDGSVGGARGGLMSMAQGGYAVGGGLGALAGGGQTGYNLGGYSDGGRLLRGPGDGVSDSIPATIGDKQPARLADGEFVVPARIVSELGNGSTEAGARKLYAMMDRVQKARGKTTGKNRVAANTRSDKYLPA
jgi:hypothetical protein